MKKILIVCHDFTFSGANLAMLDWIRARQNSDFQLYVLLPRPNAKMEQALIAAGCTVWVGYFVLSLRHLTHLSISATIKAVFKRIYSIFVHPLIKIFLLRRLRIENIDLVHSNSFATLLGCELAMAAHLPHIWHIREFMDEDYQITHLNKEHEEECCRYSHAIFISSAIAHKYGRIHQFLSQRTIYDRVTFDSTYKKKRIFMEDGVCRILIAGVLSENKGQHEAIRAVRMLHNAGKSADLIICGQGDTSIIEDGLDNSCKEYIHYLGFRTDLTTIRKDIDIALVCSKMEAFGRVTVESMFYENVVIGANSGCTQFLISDGKTGFLYRQGDPNDLFAKIQNCITYKDNMEGIIKRAKCYALKMFTNDISSQIFEYYEHVLNA